MSPDLLEQDHPSERGHDGNVHGTDGNQQDHEAPAATDAVQPVVNPDTKIARVTLKTRVVKKRTQRCSAMAETGALRR